MNDPLLDGIFYSLTKTAKAGIRSYSSESWGNSLLGRWLSGTKNKKGVPPGEGKWLSQSVRSGKVDPGLASRVAGRLSR